MTLNSYLNSGRALIGAVGIWLLWAGVYLLVVAGAVLEWDSANERAGWGSTCIIPAGGGRMYEVQTFLPDQSDARGLAYAMIVDSAPFTMTSHELPVRRNGHWEHCDSVMMDGRREPLYLVWTRPADGDGPDRLRVWKEGSLGFHTSPDYGFNLDQGRLITISLSESDEVLVEQGDIPEPVMSYWDWKH